MAVQATPNCAVLIKNSHLVGKQESVLKKTFFKELFTNIEYFHTFHDSMCRQFIITATCTSPVNDMRGYADRLNDISNETEDSLPGVRAQWELGQRRKNQIISEMEINEWMSKETGFDRVKIMYSRGEDGTFLQEDTRTLNTMFRRSVLFGTVICVFLAASEANGGIKEKHLSQSQRMVKGLLNEHRVMKEVFMGAVKKAVKLTAFTAALLYLPQTIAAYRNKSSVWEYTITSVLAFGLSGIGQGARKFATLSLMGALFGSVGGFVACSVLTNQGLSPEQKHIDRIRHYLQEQKIAQKNEI